MIPIFEGSAQGARGLSSQDFRDRFLAVCDEHRRAGRAKAFAFIIYDVTDPEVSQMLRNLDYWLALDAISGTNLSVFCFHTAVLNRPDDGPDPNGLSWLTAVHAPALSTSNGELDRLLGRSERLPVPALLLFQVQNGEVIDSRVIGIEADNSHGAFLELKSVLTIAARSIAEQPYGTPPGRVFQAVEAELTRARAKIVVVRVARVLKSVLDLAALGVGLAGG